MESLICCCGARSWTRAIAWIQIVLFSVGLLLASGGLIVIFITGKDAVDKVALTKQAEGDGVYNYLNSAALSEYLKLVINFALCVVIHFVGIISAVFLIKGANENKGHYLKYWLIHSVICLVWSILTEVLSEDAFLPIILRISVSVSLYGFSIFVVMTLLRDIDIEADEERKKCPAPTAPAGFKKAASKNPPNSNIPSC